MVVESLSPWAAPLVAAVVGVLALLAAAMDACLAALAAGRPLTAAELATPLRQALRLLLQQRRTTVAPDALVWRLGGAGVLVVATLAAVVIPLGRWAAADLGIGVVWWTALMALLWAVVWLTGWGGNSAYPLVAGYRFTAQALAYEMPLAISVITVALAAGTLQVGGIVAGQAHLWYGVWMPVAFGTYLACVLAAAFWGPFGAPVAVDLAGGVTAELAGVDRLVFIAGRYVVLAVGAAFAVPLFLGGGLGPVLPAWLWSLLKTIAVLVVLVAARWRLPLVRMDRFEEWSWVVLLPLTVVQAFVVAVAVLVASR
jgi:NADH-quinone oxidoreductase subunit H